MRCVMVLTEENDWNPRPPWLDIDDVIEDRQEEERHACGGKGEGYRPVEKKWGI